MLGTAPTWGNRPLQGQARRAAATKGEEETVFCTGLGEQYGYVETNGLFVINVTKPTGYRAAVYDSILYQLAFVYLVVIYKLGFTNGFNIFDCSPINERQSWCVSPALDLNPHIYGICKTVILNLSDEKYGIGTCIWGDQISTLPAMTKQNVQPNEIK